MGVGGSGGCFGRGRGWVGEVVVVVEAFGGRGSAVATIDGGGIGSSGSSSRSGNRAAWDGEGTGKEADGGSGRHGFVVLSLLYLRMDKTTKPLSAAATVGPAPRTLR